MSNSSTADRQGAQERGPLSSPFDDALLGALVLLAGVHDRHVAPEAMVAGLPLVDGRLTPSLLVRAAERAGFAARVVRRPLTAIPSLVLPAILLLKDGRACVLVALDGQHASVLLPEIGNGVKEVSVAELARGYSGQAVFAKPAFRFDGRTPEVLRLASRHWFWGVIGRSWRIYRDVLMASLLINLFALATPLFIMNVYDRVVPNNAVETLWVLALGVVVVYVFDFIMRGLRSHFLDLAGKKADILLTSALYEKVLGIQLAARPPSVGALANHLGEFDSLRNMITSGAMSALVDLPFVALFLIVIAYVGGPLVFVPLVGIPLILLVAFAVQGPLRQAVDHTSRAAAQKQAALVEGLVGLETVKALGAEGMVQSRLEQATGYAAHWQIRSNLLSTGAIQHTVFVQQLITVGLMVLGVHLIAEGELTTGGLIAAVILSGRVLAPMVQVSNLATHFYQGLSALKTLDGLMRLPGERDRERSYVQHPTRGALEFRDVSFTYPRQSAPSLRHLSFRIEPGERVGIIGRSGSGKSTLARLILGLYPPEEGAVLQDGVDIKQVDPAELRRKVAYVPQDVTLFYGTVRDNIVFGLPMVEDGAVLQAAELAGVSEFVDQHPLGYDMPVGERGEGLSGGQRQAVAIARAMLRASPVVVMDEPSNSMDVMSESRLVQRLGEGLTGRTFVLVTHRSSLLALVDRLILLDDGRIMADGPREQVLGALKEGRIQVRRAAP
ncbi:MAG: type I secretion system permease/ATPase [Halothiobacillaceae bacterium]|nr:MAG: type I secretion system permease/ATPase [Halothiobacillaceae bacterium]